VHDELDLPFGALKLKLGGGDNGHNGLRSSANLWARRTTTGCASASGGRPVARTADYVLKRLLNSRAQGLALEVDRCADAVEALISTGLTAAQNSFHAG